MASWDQVPEPVPAAEPDAWVPPAAAVRMRAERIDGMTAAHARQVRANYYGKITLIDRWVGAVLEAIDRRGWRDDTLVVFLSDHGEMAGDHGRLHKTVFYEASIRIPLMVSRPGHTAAGTTAEGLVESIDPTGRAAPTHPSAPLPGRPARLGTVPPTGRSSVVL